MGTDWMGFIFCKRDFGDFSCHSHSHSLTYVFLLHQTLRRSIGEAFLIIKERGVVEALGPARLCPGRPSSRL